jgi:phosphonate transport system permease protein
VSARSNLARSNLARSNLARSNLGRGNRSRDILGRGPAESPHARGREGQRRYGPLTGRARPALTGMLAALVALVALWRVGLFDARALLDGALNAATFARDLWPPRTGVLPELLAALLETLEIALAGTALGAALGVPAALWSTRTVAPPAVAIPLRFVLGAVRSVPSLLWAVVAVAAFGLGPAAGAIGIAAYTVGHLGKLLAEQFEGVDPEVVEAVRGAGATRAGVLRHAVLPESRNALVSQVLYALEYNVRASSILGFVGAGGIGFHVLGYVQVLDYRALATALLVTLTAVLCLEALGTRIRRALLQASAAPGGY